MPENLMTDAFQSAWQQWVAHRREIRKALTPSTTEKQLAKLSAWGPDKAIRAIHQSIEQGWQGLFYPDQRNGCSATSGGAAAAEQAWQTVLDSLARHSRFEPERIRAEIGEPAWQVIQPIGLKRIDEANDFERRELRRRFLQEFCKQRGAA